MNSELVFSMSLSDHSIEFVRSRCSDDQGEDMQTYLTAALQE